MANIRYQYPVSLLRELQQELFPAWFQEPNLQNLPGDVWTPKVDIKEEEKEFVVYADIPGVKAEDIEVEMDGNTLTVKGHRKTEKEEKGKNYYRSECTTGKFYRQFTLPDSVDSSKISAQVKHGVLILHLPKAIESKHYRKIAVEAAEKK